MVGTSKIIVKSKLINGFIELPANLELTVVDQCNASCRTCNYASPAIPSWYVDPETVCRNFSVLTEYSRPEFVPRAVPLLSKKSSSTGESIGCSSSRKEQPHEA